MYITLSAIVLFLNISYKWKRDMIMKIVLFSAFITIMPCFLMHKAKILILQLDFKSVFFVDNDYIIILSIGDYENITIMLFLIVKKFFIQFPFPVVASEAQVEQTLHKLYYDQN